MPGPAVALQARWRRRKWGRMERKLGLPRIHREMIARHGQRVLQGPFSGMTYASSNVGSAYLPKLVGSYETELHECIDAIIATDYRRIIDVGCAEGYYAVGLAWRMPTVSIYAYDTNCLARKLCREMARVNHVADQVVIGVKCDPQELQRQLTERSLVFCDCEGYELELLRPDLAPRLRSADVLVELHEHIRPGLTAAILDRFRATHDVQIISLAERRPGSYKGIEFLKAQDQELAVKELRPGNEQWAFIRSKTNGGEGVA